MIKLSKLLLVDDDSTTNFVNQMLIEDLGIADEVLIAHNGEEAMQIVEEECRRACCPRLILVDVNMPVMNGFEFLEAFNALESRRKDAVVIMLTTSSNGQDLDKANSYAIQGYLNKPLTKEKIMSVMQNHLMA